MAGDDGDRDITPDRHGQPSDRPNGMVGEEPIRNQRRDSRPSGYNKPEPEKHGIITC